MKTLILLIFFVSFAINAQTSLPKYMELESRIQTVDNFQAQFLPTIKAGILSSYQEIESNTNPKFIAADKNQQANYLKRIAALKVQVESAEQSLSTSNAKAQMIKLKKAIDERNLFFDAQDAIKDLENNNRNSKKLTKYFNFLKDGNYTRAQISFALLNADEKDLASEYEKNHTYILRESNVQDHLRKEITTLKQKIAKDLSYPEAAVQKAQTSAEEEQLTMEQFRAFIKTIDNSIQFDYALPSTWELGLFSCESKNHPRYLRFKNFPSLVVLDNEGSYNSVIELSPSDPNKLSVIYHCTKMGSFGGCLENKNKKLCQLDNACAEALAELETSFDRNSFFKSIQNSMAEQILTQKKKELANPEIVTIFSELARTNRLGFYTKEESLQLIDQIIEKSKGIQSNTPEDFYKKISLELSNLEKQEKSRLKKKPGYSATNDKTKDSLRILTYLIATMKMDLEDLKNNDKLQEFSYGNCGNDEKEHLEFCQKYNSYTQKVKLFEPVEEIHNFVSEECPRLVFRFQNATADKSPEFSSCTPMAPVTDGNINKLMKDTKDVLNKQ